jgi:NADPH:quinone reductase-like Zn-dependent oxidoreductase
MALPSTMQAVILTGHGGPDRLELRGDWPVPVCGEDEVLIRVGAAGVNNTDVNTRTGWYSRAVTGGTAASAAGATADDGGWAGLPLEFPRIQGADICGRVVAAGAAVDEGLVGRRVLVRTTKPGEDGAEGLVTVTVGSEMDGGFADYVAMPAKMVVPVECGWTDIELASIPCAWSTAENMLERIGVVSGDRVLVTGASGGVGSAAVQLARRRGAHVTAIAAGTKHDFLERIGAERRIARDEDPATAIGRASIDVIVDLVGGQGWSTLLACLKRGGRYVVSGAIAGPIVPLDLRDLYLNDWTLKGATWQPMEILENLVRYIEAGEIRPVVSKTYPLSAIREAQADFVAKVHPGKLVLVPDALWNEPAADLRFAGTRDEARA